MKVAVVQTRPRFGDREDNLKRALDLMGGLEADLFVLPELFATGYFFTSREELERFAEPVSGDIVEALKAFSRQKECIIHAGFAESEGDRVYNSSALVISGELAATYRKLHLFKKEKEIFDRASGPPVVVDAPGARLGLMICWDWIFPEMARTLALRGAQLLCHPSNLVLHWCQRAMVVRSVENGVFTLLANRVGEDVRGEESLTFTGGSEIVSPKGEILAQASSANEEVITAEIDPQLADDKMFTTENHLFGDRRPEYYGL